MDIRQPSLLSRSICTIKVKMDSLVFKKRSREIWTYECERCTGGQFSKTKKRSRRFCMKCDRPSDDLKCYQIREGLKFVWQPKLRFHLHVYFEHNLQKIKMPGLIYHKNELLKLFKSCKILCDEHGKVTMFRGGIHTLDFTMQVKYGRMAVTFHGDVMTQWCATVSNNHSEEHSVQLTEDELCVLLSNIDLDYPNIIKKQQYGQQ